MFVLNKNGCELLIDYYQKQLAEKQGDLTKKIAELYAAGSTHSSAVTLAAEITKLQHVISYIELKLLEFKNELPNL